MPVGVQTGFTIIELIVVLMMMGILAAAAYPRLSSRSFDDAGYRDQLNATLSFARKAAIAQRRVVQVALDGGVISLQIANHTPESADRQNMSPGTSRPLNLPGSDSPRLTPRGATTVTGPDKLFFAPIGSAVASSFVYTIRGERTLTLAVDPQTGYVR